MNYTRILHPQREALINFTRSKRTRRAENTSTIYSTDPPRRKGIAGIIPERLQLYDTTLRSIHAVSRPCIVFLAFQLWYGRQRSQVPIPRGHTGSMPQKPKNFLCEPACTCHESTSSDADDCENQTKGSLVLLTSGAKGHRSNALRTRAQSLISKYLICFLRSTRSPSGRLGSASDLRRV